MRSLKVLIADDSALYRSQIRSMLSQLPGVEVLGAVSNGQLAIEKMVQKLPDLLILDLEMPVMDGLQTLQEMQKRNLKTKVLVFSSASKRGAEITMDALRGGASDFVTKPGDQDISKGISIDPRIKIQTVLEPKIQALFPQPNESVSFGTRHVHTTFSGVTWELFRPQAVVIGCSTGGPTILEKIFENFSGPLSCPVLVVQHMPPIFTSALAERIQKISGIECHEAKHGMPVEKNKIYIAPGGYHMRLSGNVVQAKITLDQEAPIHSVRPAVDPLFSSAASIFKEKCLGFVLTGMGYDGKEGAESIKRHGGAMIIQNEESCVVFGMPGAVFAAKAYDRIATPEEIIEILNEKVRTAA